MSVYLRAARGGTEISLMFLPAHIYCPECLVADNQSTLPHCVWTSREEGKREGKEREVEERKGRGEVANAHKPQY